MSDPVLPSLREAWEHHAEQWIAYARTPGHDHCFWAYNLPRFLETLPPGRELTVDVGCGEGRVARALTGLGHRVVGLDSSPTLAACAASHSDEPVLTTVADAAALPLPNGVADRAVAFMSLQDVHDLERAVGELGRVLRGGGILCIAILHPLTTSGEFVDDSIDSDFVVEHPYRSPRRLVDVIERDGLTMEFHSMHRPLAAYASTLHDAGFVIDVLAELGPRPKPWRSTRGWRARRACPGSCTSARCGSADARSSGEGLVGEGFIEGAGNLHPA